MFSRIRRVIAELDVHTHVTDAESCPACQSDALAQARTPAEVQWHHPGTVPIPRGATPLRPASKSVKRAGTDSDERISKTG